MEDTSKIHSSWLGELKNEFEAPYFIELNSFLEDEEKLNTIYPQPQLIFEAFKQTPFEKVKVVIIGQDPYHGPNQANGLSFSVPNGTALPPSLRNIFKELASDINIKIPKSGNLIKWAQEGVLMLNATLTVRANSAGSHQKKGWEKYTDAVIETISRKKENIVFILWGKNAQEKGSIIDEKRHLIIRSAHPSPFAAHRGFFNSKPFSKTNNYLQLKNIKPVNWSLTDS